jgi:hypothetical protein
VRAKSPARARSEAILYCTTFAFLSIALRTDGDSASSTNTSLDQQGPNRLVGNYESSACNDNAKVELDREPVVGHN